MQVTTNSLFLTGSVNAIALVFLEQAVGSSNVIYIRMLEYESI